MARHVHEQIMDHAERSSAKHSESLKRLLDRDKPDFKH